MTTTDTQIAFYNYERITMYKFKILPYKLGSQSAKVLSQSLNVLRVRDSYVPRRNEIIINWGNSKTVTHYPTTNLDLNKHDAIAIACNKLKTFNKLNGLGFTHIPDYTIHDTEAQGWLQEGNKVYCRTSLTGHSGSGIVIASNFSELVNAPLYTVQTKHKYEFRAHVFKGNLIDIQQKKKRSGVEANSEIRNHSNGYIYARSDIIVPDIVSEASLKAVELLGLDFGAVDIGYRERDNKAFVFEVNTAPGLVGTTLTKYTNAFTNYIRSI
jgi:hypothetical protein